jgi:hypothetical protein
MFPLNAHAAAGDDVETIDGLALGQDRLRSLDL